MPKLNKSERKKLSEYQKKYSKAHYKRISCAFKLDSDRDMLLYDVVLKECNGNKLQGFKSLLYKGMLYNKEQECKKIAD